MPVPPAPRQDEAVNWKKPWNRPLDELRPSLDSQFRSLIQNASSRLDVATGAGLARDALTRLTWAAVVVVTGTAVVDVVDVEVATA